MTTIANIISTPFLHGVYTVIGCYFGFIGFIYAWAILMRKIRNL